MKGGMSKMSVLKEKEKAGSESSGNGATEEAFVKEVVIPIIATARPGLSGAESALMRRLPANYSGKTVREVLGYIISSEASSDESQTVTSLRNELGAAGSVVVINGRAAKLTDKVDQYLVDGTKKIGEREVQYRQLEIEVSAVQQGGYRF